MALTTRQRTHLCELVIGAANQTRVGMQTLVALLNEAQCLSSGTGVPLGELFGTNPAEVIHQDRTAGQMVAAVMALAQIYALSNDLAATPVIGEVAATGHHLDAIVELA